MEISFRSKRPSIQLMVANGARNSSRMKGEKVEEKANASRCENPPAPRGESILAIQRSIKWMAPCRIPPSDFIAVAVSLRIGGTLPDAPLDKARFQAPEIDRIKE